MPYYLATDNKFIFWASISSFVSLFITLLLLWRTHRISVAINKFKVTGAYNDQRIEFREKFKGFRLNILEDNLSGPIFEQDLYELIKIFEMTFKPVLRVSDRYHIFIIIHTLRNDKKHDLKIIAGHLTHLISRLSIDKEA